MQINFTIDYLGVRAGEARILVGSDLQAVELGDRHNDSARFASKRDTFIWFCDHESEVPVRVSAEFAVGSVVVNLADYRPGGQLARN
jgi:hypothetical protein